MITNVSFSVKGMPIPLCNGYKFFEIGVNLLDNMYRGIYNGKQKHEEDILDVLQRGKEIGVMRSICTAGNLEDSIEALKLARLVGPNYDLFCTVGVHPTRANELDDSDDAERVMREMREIIADGKTDGRVVAVGECGLDYDRLHFCSKEMQMKAFKLQLDFAHEVNLPMFLHNRNTDGDFLNVITEERSKIKAGGVVHSFDGSLEEMHKLVELGFYIGINGCSLRTEENLNVVREIRADRMLLETDSPWCGVKPSHAGHKYVKTEFPRKKAEKYEIGTMVKDRNEPCTMIQILEIVAAVRDTDPKILAEQIYKNSEDLFFPKNVCSQSFKD